MYEAASHYAVNFYVFYIYIQQLVIVNVLEATKVETNYLIDSRVASCLVYICKWEAHVSIHAAFGVTAVVIFRVGFHKTW